MLSVAGFELLPPLPTFLAFVAAGLALNILPGADMTFVIASAARAGRRDGIIAAVGIGGAAYLLYIAVSLVISGERRGGGPQSAPRQSGWRLFRAAAFVNILNPKVALFFLAFLPQFVDTSARIPALQILCLGLWFDLVGTFVNIIIAVLAASTAERLRHVRWIGRAARWLAATAMGALALRLAFAERR